MSQNLAFTAGYVWALHFTPITSMPRFPRILPLVLISAVTISTSGCFLVAAGAGAGAAIAYTQRGASVSMPGSVDAVFGKAQSAFSAMRISETGQSTENSGTTRRLVGKNADNEITVEIKRSTDAVVVVEVVAKKNIVDYDKDYAKRVLDTIVGK